VETTNENKMAVNERARWQVCASGAFRAAGAISLFCGVAVAFAMMSIAWSHNPQGEIHLDGVVDWGYWFQIGFSWVVVTVLVLLPPTFAGALLWYRYVERMLRGLRRSIEGAG
jgi:hypothetical protein